MGGGFMVHTLESHGQRVEERGDFWRQKRVAMEVKPVQLNKVLVTEIRAATINEAHVMCITVNRVLVIFYSVEARDRILTSEGPVICVEEETLEPASFEWGRVLIESSSLDRIEYKEDQTDGSSSERGDMMVNLEVSDTGNSLERGVEESVQETVVEEGECPEVNRVASQETNVGEKEQVMWRGNQFWDVAGDAIESHVQAAQECFGSKLLDLDGLNGHMNLGPVGPVIPPKGSTTEVIMRPRKGGEAPVGMTPSISFSYIADILIMDSDVNYRQNAILWEAKAMGLGSVSKRRTFQLMLRKQEVEMVFFQETKLTTINNLLVKHVWWYDSYAFDFVQSIGGDFNEVTSSAERHGCVGDRGGLLEFADIIHDGDFVDLPTTGKVFMWYGSSSKGCRLDRFLVSVEWSYHFEGLEQCNLPCNMSDHDLISEAHRTSSVVDKLTNLKVYLKQWNRESFNCVDSQIETTMTLLNELDERVTELDVDTISLRCKA
ncbi:hypothetical protein V6N13_025038 [Hibiscus sabdariffa]